MSGDNDAITDIAADLKNGESNFWTPEERHSNGELIKSLAAEQDDLQVPVTAMLAVRFRPGIDNTYDEIAERLRDFAEPDEAKELTHDHH